MADSFHSVPVGRSSPAIRTAPVPTCNRKKAQRTLQSGRRADQNAAPTRSSVMDEYVARMYLREEDFLEAFYGTVEALLPQLGGWRPNYQCDDAARWCRDQLRREGKLDALTFDSAV